MHMELALSYSESVILKYIIQSYLKGFNKLALNDKTDRSISNQQYSGASDLKFMYDHLPDTASYYKGLKYTNLSRERAGLCLYIIDLGKKYHNIKYSSKSSKRLLTSIIDKLTCVVLGVKSLSESDILERAKQWEAKHKK